MALIETYYGPNGHFEPEKDKTKYGPNDKENLFTADSFLNFIRRSNSTWYEGHEIPNEQKWVYRGHADANWKLIPSAGRPLQHNPISHLIQQKINAPNIKHGLEGNEKNCRAFIHANQEALRNFHEKAIRGGFISPNNSEQNSQKNRDAHQDFILHYNIEEEMPYLSLAQHHNIPTFLLDWSNNPWIAAYFATKPTSGCTDNFNKIDMCVWALNVSEIIAHNEVFFQEGVDDAARLKIIKPSRIDNQYLKAQDGLFTILRRDAYLWEETGEYPALEDILTHWLKQNLKIHFHFTRSRDQKQNKLKTIDINKKIETLVNERLPQMQSVLRKVILPKCEILSLRKLLQVEGISTAQLKPSLDNIAREVLEDFAQT